MDKGNTQQVFSVAELTCLLKETLEARFPDVWVCGEVTDVSRPRSGHIYFTLKDTQAQIRAVLWRSTVSRLRFEVEDGMEVVCGGGLDLYPPRGTYQLVVRKIEPRGLGSLQLALRQLQERLAAEGLFATEHKQAIPAVPRRVAFVTSPTGAAIRDFCQVARRRWSGTEIIVIPARVQGTGAAEEIVAGIAAANRIRPRCDVLVVGRGGGSIEDLWCFNEESVVRAIFASQVPVVSAVGHEIDVTLSDLVADVRALTPSEAAELVVPSAEQLKANLVSLRRRLAASLGVRVSTARARLQLVRECRALRRPLERIHEWTRRLDDRETRLVRAAAMRYREASQRVRRAASHLEALNPLAVLARGFSLTQRTSDGQIVTGSDQLEVGQQITTRLARGSLVSRVEQRTADAPADDPPQTVRNAVP